MSGRGGSSLIRSNLRKRSGGSSSNTRAESPTTSTMLLLLLLLLLLLPLPLLVPVEVAIVMAMHATALGRRGCTWTSDLSRWRGERAELTAVCWWCCCSRSQNVLLADRLGSHCCCRRCCLCCCSRSHKQFSYFDLNKDLAVGHIKERGPANEENGTNPYTHTRKPRTL